LHLFLLLLLVSLLLTPRDPGTPVLTESTWPAGASRLPSHPGLSTVAMRATNLHYVQAASYHTKAK
ncbi:hypothetical protein Pcinc_042765, partial [Petrolisthes cinctipes]